jgi:hydrogenase maturation protease
MTMERPSIVIIGMGNVLMQDEGIGVRAVEAFDCQFMVPLEVSIVDGGTTGMELMSEIRGCDHLIVADAVNTGAPAGAIVRLVDEQVPAFFQTRLSNHQLGLADILALLRLEDGMPGSITIIGLVPFELQNVLGLSAGARQALPTMVELLADELRTLGVTPERRKTIRRGFWAEQDMLEKAASCA